MKWIITLTVSYYSVGPNLDRCCVTSVHIYHHSGQKVALQLDDSVPFKTDKSGPILRVLLARVGGWAKSLV